MIQEIAMATMQRLSPEIVTREEFQDILGQYERVIETVSASKTSKSMSTIHNSNLSKLTIAQPRPARKRWRSLTRIGIGRRPVCSPYRTQKGPWS